MSPASSVVPLVGPLPSVFAADIPTQANRAHSTQAEGNLFDFDFDDDSPTGPTDAFAMFKDINL